MYSYHKQLIQFLKSQIKAKCKNRNDLPPGVLWIKPDNIYASQCRVGKSRAIWLGRSHDPMVCFRRYKICKENYIKQVADEYKGRIPDKLYNALYNYEVKIDNEIINKSRRRYLLD